MTFGYPVRQFKGPLAVVNPIPTGGMDATHPLRFFEDYSETVQFSILKFSDFSQMVVADIFCLIHFFVSFLVWAVEGHFFAYILEFGPKNGDFQNFLKNFQVFFS